MKCLETRKSGGMTRRRYRNEDGSMVTTYEVSTELVNVADLKALIRKAAGRKNLQTSKPTLASDPDKVDAVLASIEAGVTHRTIAAMHGVSTKTIQRVKWGYR